METLVVGDLAYNMKIEPIDDAVSLVRVTCVSCPGKIHPVPDGTLLGFVSINNRTGNAIRQMDISGGGNRASSVYKKWRDAVLHGVVGNAIAEKLRETTEKGE